MNKQLKIALLPAAVAAAMLSNSAFAGTSSCFETWSELGDTFTSSAVTGSGSSAQDLLAITYTNAECSASAQDLTKLADLETSGATSLINVASDISIASEITNDFKAPGFVRGSGDYTAAYDASTDNLIALTYIPTTELPSATRIKMQLNGADFGEQNANQLFLLKAKPDTNEYVKVASSDGTLNNSNEVLFVVGNEPIGAGTRLAISSDGVVPAPVHYATKRTGCDLNSDITLTVTEAKNGVNDIIGGKGSTITLASIKAQYGVLFGPKGSELQYDAPTKAFSLNKTGAQQDDVDAASEDSSRIAFVGGLKTSEAVAYITNSNPTFGVPSANTLKLNYTINTTSPAGDGVKAVIFENGTEVDFDGNKFTDFSDTVITSSDIRALAQTGAHTTPAMKFVVENMADSEGNFSIMNFNYMTQVKGNLTVGTPTLDSCEATVATHDIGVNGAVLKVPYLRSTNKDQWVKITNESSKPAKVLLDIFNEKDADAKATGVLLGEVAGNATVTYFGADLVKKAEEAGYTAGAEYNHTATFTVTAPEASVHGVSSQFLPGKGERVIPVLRASKDVVSIDQASGKAATEAAAWKW